MTRHEMRDRTFRLLFRTEFHNAEEIPEQVKLFCEDEENANQDPQQMQEVQEKFEKAREMIPQLDKLINDNTTGWDTSRMGKVEVAVLRLAVYEMCFDDSIPDGVAIDEAVELAKTYGQANSGGFVNAILTKIQKAYAASKEEAKTEE